MIKLEIIIEDDVDAVTAKQIMEERKNTRDLVYEQKTCLEYLEKVCRLPPVKYKAMVEELSKISVLKARYIALIINMLPETEEELEALFSKERTNLKKDEIKQILDIVNKGK